MKNRRKTNECLNCGSFLLTKENYCPNCGQENTDNYIDFRQLFNDFFSHYLSLDSRFARSFKPFFIRPGALTVEFIEGKRVRYANPIRLYLVISIVHFFIFSMMLKSDDDFERGFNVGLSDEQQPELEKLDSLAALPDSIRNPEDEWISDYQYLLIEKLKNNDTLSEQQIFDSLHVENKTAFRKWFIKRIIRLEKSSDEQLSGFIITNIPIMMFFILPIFALLLKLFFYKKGYYILHLIHSLHIHSFAFFVLMLFWLFVWITGIGEEQIILWVVAINTAYILISFRRVYQQKYVLLFFKLLTIGFMYTIILSISLILEVIVSLATF